MASRDIHAFVLDLCITCALAFCCMLHDALCQAHCCMMCCGAPMPGTALGAPYYPCCRPSSRRTFNTFISKVTRYV